MIRNILITTDEGDIRYASEIGCVQLGTSYSVEGKLLEGGAGGSDGNDKALAPMRSFNQEGIGDSGEENLQGGGVLGADVGDGEIFEV
jgi:hypothetical protein